MASKFDWGKLNRLCFSSAMSGSVASVFAMMMCYPLDRVRSLVQIHQVKGNVISILMRLLNDEGVMGLYRGLTPMLMALGFSNFVYFYFYTALKAYVQLMRPKAKRTEEISAVMNLVLASVAGTINVFLTTPFWVAYTRLAMQASKKKSDPADNSKNAATDDDNVVEYNGMFDTISKIAKSEGLPSLWNGLIPSLILVSNPTIQFAAYEKVKNLMLYSKYGSSRHQNTEDVFLMDTSTQYLNNVEKIVEENLSSFDYFVLGALAKCIATVLTYPLQVAQSRMRADAKDYKEQLKEKDANGNITPKNKPSPSRKYKNTMHCLMHMYKSEGFLGMYSGMDAKMVQTCLTSAIMFASYENIQVAVMKLFLWTQGRKSIK